MTTATIERPEIAKSSFSITELGKELERVANSKQDSMVPTRLIHVTTGDTSGSTGIHFGNQSHVMNNTAHNQLSEYAGIPGAFYRTLRENPNVYKHDDSPLFDTLVNGILRADKYEKDKRLIRTLDGKARAVLSDRFSLDLDNFDVYNVAANTILNMGLDVEDIINSSVTETSMYIKVVNKRLQGDVKLNDTIQAGFILSNSEVGMGSLSIRQFIYRLVCLNGMVTEQPVRQRHVGAKMMGNDNLVSIIYANDTQQAEAKERLLQMRDHIKDAMDEHKFNRTLQLMRGSTEIMKGDDVLPSEIIDVTRKRYNMSKDEGKLIELHMIQDKDMSLWGLSNAITRTAQDFIDYDRSVELESIGGQLLHMTAREKQDLMNAKN